MIHLLIVFLILVFMLGLVWWIVSVIPLPIPAWIIQAAFGIIVLIILLYALLGVVGGPAMRW